MGIYLSTYFDKLPPQEIKRLQKSLKIILRHYSDKEGIRRSLQSIYSQMGAPGDILKKSTHDSEKVLLRLLDSFGILGAEQMSQEERNLLKEMPYTIWPDDRLCLISAEAHNFFATDPSFRREGFLFAYLQNLPIREKKAWARWNDMPDNKINERERTGFIYFNLARLHFTNRVDVQIQLELNREHKNHQHNISDNRFIAYLDDIFPNNPLKCPVAWFYRGVLSLYDSFAETERCIYKLSKSAQKMLLGLKRGQIIVEIEPAIFGKRERYKLIRTREKAIGPLPPFLSAPDANFDLKENFLF